MSGPEAPFVGASTHGGLGGAGSWGYTNDFPLFHPSFSIAAYLIPKVQYQQNEKQAMRG